MHARRPKLVGYPLFTAIVLASVIAPQARGGWAPLLRAPNIYGVRPLSASNRGSTPLCVGSGDFNGDGLPDLAVGNSANGSGVSVLLHTGSSGYAPAFKAGGEYPNRRANSLAVADLNSDDRMDVVTSDPLGIAFLLNSGTGFTLGLHPDPRSWDSRRVATGDMDGDGAPEVAVLSWAYDRFRISVAHGPINDLAQPYDSVFAFPPDRTKVSGFRVADMTGDGRCDVVAAYRDTVSQYGTLVILANYQSGSGFATVLQVHDYGLDEIEVAFLNADAIPDVAAVDKFGQGVTVFLGTGGGSFLPPAHVSATGPEFVSAGDLDGDGDTDLVTVSRNNDLAGTLCVLRGNGDGTFMTPGEDYDGLPGSGPAILVDVNRDGRPDIIAPQSGPDIVWAGSSPLAHSVAVFLQDGTGGFRASVPSNLGIQLHARAIADFNRDGKPDVAVASGGNVIIGIGAGDGNFSMGGSLAVGPTVDMLVAEDTNLDGKADLWVQSSGNFLQGYPGLGDGSFGPAAGPALPGTIYRRSVADMNRDGWPDLILGDGGAVRVFVQSLPDFFLSMGQVNPSVGLNSIATGDWNRDGIRDLAVAGPGGASTFQGDGTGSLSMAENVLLTGRAYTDICAGDFNRDGILDLAARENRTSLPLDRGVDVFFGNASGGFSAPTSLGTLEQNGLEIRTWDVNRDGNLDLIVPGTSDAGIATYLFASVDYFLGNGAGGFGLRSSYSLAPIYTADSQGRGYVTMGDVDRNSVPDVLSGTFRVDSYLATPPSRGSTLQPTVFYPTLNSPDDVAIGDLNRDGRLDAVTASLDVNPGVAVLLGTGGGTLGPSTPLPQSLSTHRVRLADLNRDGILDIVASNNAGGLSLVSSMLGLGNGTFGARTDHFINAGLDIEIGDMNRDGIPDVVTATQDSIRVLQGSGTGTFSPSSAFVVSSVSDLELGDVNRDGVQDVICVGTALSIIYGRAAGGLGPKATYGGPVTSAQTVCVSDVNRDGFIDILAPQAGTLYVLWGAPGAPYIDYASASLASPAFDLGVGEAQADGAPFVYVARNTSSLELFSVSSTGNLASAGSYTITNTPESLVLGDMNRDGVIDVLSVGSGASQLGVTLNGTATITGVAAAAAPARRVRLDQNYPNPFNPRTTIRFALPEQSRVRLSIHDVSGRLLSVLEDGVMPAGEHSIPWPGMSDDGRPVASGVYYYRLATESGVVESRRMVVVR